LGSARKRILLLVVALLGCRHGPGAAVPGENGKGPKPSPSPTAPAQPEWIPPSVVLRGAPGQGINRDFAAFPAYGGHPGTLFVWSGSQPEPYPQTWAHFPRMFVLSGDLPRGEHPITDVWDGVSGVPFIDGFTAAGDVDHDGHMDVWCNNRKLYRGPFLGRELTSDDVLAEAECCPVPMIGDFDADGDGELDALLGAAQTARIYYGPFEGVLPLWGDDPDITNLALDAPACTGIRGAFRIRDYFGPGQDAVGVGGAPGDDCFVETRFYELTGPRGRQLGIDDAFSQSESGRSQITHFYGLDIDGDGRPEVLSGLDRFLKVYQNPIAPWFQDTPKAWDTGRFVADPVGDVNGDGLEDLVAEIEDDAGDIWYGLVLAPFDTTRPIDDTVAVPLTPHGQYDTPLVDGVPFYLGIGQIAMDLDGDGLSDLIALGGGHNGEGFVSIWYGADLVDAIARRTQP
jgi:hypothetical protein